MSRVLVIEDSPSIALLLKRRLEMAGHSVRVLGNGTDALAALASEGLPDIVLADVTMPGMDGISTLREIKARHVGLKVILVTAQSLEPPAHEEADAVIDKPIDFGRLLSVLERLAP